MKDMDFDNLSVEEMKIKAFELEAVDYDEIKAANPGMKDDEIFQRMEDKYIAFMRDELKKPPERLAMFRKLMKEVRPVLKVYLESREGQ
jgi:hypothetical protein